jgi:hypothetical protein
MDIGKLKELSGNDKMYTRDLKDISNMNNGLNYDCSLNSNSIPRNVFSLPSARQAIGLTSHDNYNMMNMRVRSDRASSAGDMFCSGFGQKGTAGIIFPEINLPYNSTQVDIISPQNNNSCEENDSDNESIPELVENFDHDQNTEDVERKQQEISNEILELLTKEKNNNK